MRRALVIFVGVVLGFTLGVAEARSKKKPSSCCKRCNPAKSKPCGDSCIPISSGCEVGAGCAC